MLFVKWSNFGVAVCQPYMSFSACEHSETKKTRTPQDQLKLKMCFIAMAKNLTGGPT